MSEDVKKDAEATEVVSTPEAETKKVETARPVRGGFMGGGLATTLLFLIAFFMVSYSLGVATERNNKLANLAGSAGTTAAGTTQSTFNVDGFKKLAADLKLDTGKFNACLDENKTAEAVKSDTNFGAKTGVQGTPSFVINGTALVGAQPYENFRKVLDGEVKTPQEVFKMVYPNVSPIPDTKAEPGMQDGEKIDVNYTADASRVKGDKNAPITIYEFSDFECPYCGAFYQNTYKQILDNYVNKGKAKIVFVDNPLTQIHPNAQKAAEAARCAQDQGKFWEMHDKLFELQLSNRKS